MWRANDGLHLPKISNPSDMIEFSFSFLTAFFYSVAHVNDDRWMKSTEP